MPELLLEKPHGRDEALISPKMWKHITTQALYQLFWLFLIVYGAPRVLPAFSVRGAPSQRISPGMWHGSRSSLDRRVLSSCGRARRQRVPCRLHVVLCAAFLPKVLRRPAAVWWTQ